MDQTEIEEVIAKNLAVKAEYERLVSDELTDRGDPGPASDEAIAATARALGQNLPEGYRALLQVRNGIRHFDGDSHILAVEELTRDWVKRECAAKAELFVEFEDENPLAKGAIPILIGEDSNALLLWLPERGVFAEYDIVEHIDDYETLFDYIGENTATFERLVKKESGEAS